jgi:hypothetical protein
MNADWSEQNSLKADCDKSTTHIHGDNGLEITIEDDLSPFITEGKCMVDIQHNHAMGGRPRGTRITLYLT